MPGTLTSRLCRSLGFSLVLSITLGSAQPSPFGPLPSPSQLVWQNSELSAFLHFSMNTFTDKEWGYGDEPESLFAPTDFDATALVSSLRDAGMKIVILTCKHHDGFCLWPTATTTHSVKKSPWRNGKGDVVKEISDACRSLGVKFGVYLSPWDRNSAAYGTPEYMKMYREQLTELLTRYGEIAEVWFDGANGGDGYYGGARETRTIDRKTYYRWPDIWNLVRSLQPNAVIFSDGGPDVRWVGDEEGYAGETNWSRLRRDEVYPGYDRYTELITGHADGTHWVPAECDVSIRPGWFYHAREDSLVKTAAALTELYFRSVGRNAVLLLNVPPDRRGRIHDTDLRELKEFKRMRDEAFRTNLAGKGTARASNIREKSAQFPAANVVDGNNETYWCTDDSVTRASITVDLERTSGFDCVMLREYIALGQRIDSFTVEAASASGWQELARGTTIGSKRLVRFPRTVAASVRINIISSRACPLISEIGVFDGTLKKD